MKPGVVGAIWLPVDEVMGKRGNGQRLTNNAIKPVSLTLSFSRTPDFLNSSTPFSLAIAVFFAALLGIDWCFVKMKCLFER